VSVEPTSRLRSRRSDSLTPRRIVALALAAPTMAFLLPNREDVSFQLLGFQVTGPLWFASLALLATGVAIGVLISTRSAIDDGR